MNSREARRVSGELTDAQRDRLARRQQQVAAELPDMVVRDQMRKDAREEDTLSGELRRAIHASDQSLAELATQVGITPVILDDFLTGERTLRSDVLDRLARTLGYALAPARSLPS
jgi:hypothetical protein